MRQLQRTLALLMVLVLAFFAVGCSTPSVAISVDGREYSTGEYMAYLYNNATSLYYYYSNYGDVTTMWDQELPYTNPYTLTESSEEESKVESKAESGTESGTETSATEESFKIAEYLQKETTDQILYLAAVEALMKENDISISDENMKKAYADLEQYSEEDLLTKGFSKENFSKMYIATQYDEDTLFDGLYGKGGKQEVAEKDVRAYFDKNFLAYEIIQITTVDADGNSLSESEIAKIRERLEGYYDVYEQTGDFDKAVAKYDADSSSDKSDSTKEDTTEEDSNSEGGLNWDGTITNVTSNTSDNVRTMNAATESDQDLVKAVLSVDEGDVEIVEYNQNGTSAMLALIYRIDPDGKGRETYYDDSRSDVLKAIKSDEFKELCVKKMEEMSSKVVINKRALNMVKPKEFFS